MVGFDFTLARDADIEVIGNVGVGDANPHAKINVIDNTSTTTLTTANIYYPCVFTNGTTYTCKIGLANNRMTWLSAHSRDAYVSISYSLSVGNNNRTISSAVRKNIFVTSLSGNGTVVTVTTTVPHNLQSGTTIQVTGWTPTGYNTTALTIITVTGSNSFTYANTTTGAVTVTGVCGAILSPITIRAATSGAYYNSTIIGYIQDVIQDDYIEMYISSTSAGDTVTVSDVNWLMIAH
jgi:hypothetical protein